MRNNDYIYDIETYPNIFTCGIQKYATGERWLFEISDRMNQGLDFYTLLVHLRIQNANMVGFNNIGFDYPVIHQLIQQQGHIACGNLYDKATSIIDSNGEFGHTIWASDRFINQIDLYKIHHFDNASKRTSLKVLEINMGMDNVSDLPYEPGSLLDDHQKDRLINYMWDDIDATASFHTLSLPLIEFRQTLTKEYKKDFTNYSDSKIGSEIFISELNKAGVPTKCPVTKQMLQTPRVLINVADIILPYIQFEHPEFNRILDFFKSQKIDPYEIKGFFKNLTASIDGFDFDFGAGGIHGSIHREVVCATDTHDLIDSDVASYYPNLAIKNQIYPAHLSSKFCDVYLDLYNKRKQYPKSNPLNRAIKESLVSVYGNSNSVYSPFYDPQYTCSITINGQLSLCMLAEKLMKIPGLKMVQINTDGLSYLCPKQYREYAMQLSAWWDGLTGLELEHVDYSKMIIRDVNNYIAVKTDGSMKRIGAYAYTKVIDDPATREVPWHKNHSSLIIQKAAVAAMIYNQPIENTIHRCTDPLDFIIKAKVDGKSRWCLDKPVWWGDDKVLDRPTKIQKTSRIYVSKKGGKLVKIMPPTKAQIDHYQTGHHYQHRNTGDYKVIRPGAKPPSGMYDPVADPVTTPPDRRIGYQVGWGVKECNNLTDFDWSDLDYDYYINEAKKLVIA